MCHIEYVITETLKGAHVPAGNLQENYEMKINSLLKFQLNKCKLNFIEAHLRPF
jgi:hypothetical protein